MFKDKWTAYHCVLKLNEANQIMIFSELHQ